MTTIRNNIPTGYKFSPLGIIPEDWEVKRLGDLCNDISSGRNKIRTELGKYPVYGSTGIIGMTDKYQYEGDKILVARVGAHAGLVSKASGKYDVSDNTIIVENKQNYSIDFAYNQLVFMNLNKLVFGSGQPLITSGMLKRLYVLYPKKEEQARICDLLSLWDTAIAKQTALIEHLTLRKRGLMQQLLTGKKRLEGFNGAWKEMRMEDMASFTGGGTPSTKRSDFWEGTIPWISSSDLVEDCLSNNESRYITEEAIASSTTQLLPSKSILIVTRVGVGKVAIAKHPICVSQDFTCLTKYNADTLFLAYSLLLTMKKKKSQSQGTSIKGISTDEISKIKLIFPSIEEQKAIASVLVNADKEIEIQKQKLAAMQEQKKGLMQVLLTGKRRTK